MAAFNVLDGHAGSYTVVIHIATPAGNNSAGIPWSTAVVNSGRNKTVMATGTGAGQISTADASAIAAGTLLEASMQWQDDPSWTSAQRVSNVTMMSNRLGQDLINAYSDQLKYYGFTQ